MSVCVYLFCDRVIHCTPLMPYSKPIYMPGIAWYIVNSDPPVPWDEMVRSKDYGYSLNKGFYRIEEPLPVQWGERDNVVRKIQILGGLNTLINTHKLKYTDNSVGQPLADMLLFDEIREYRATNSLENCVILMSLIDTQTTPYTPDALVAKLWLRFESYRTVVAYLNRLEFTIRGFLDNNDFDKALETLNYEIEKMRI